MIPWCSGGQQRNTSRIESYTNSGPSGVRFGAKVPLCDDHADETPADSQTPDCVRVIAGRSAERPEACTHQGAGAGPESKSVGFVAVMVVALNEKPVAGHHP